MTSQQNVSVLRQSLYLTAVIAAGWLVCFWPARMLGGESGVWWMSIAAGACLGPGWFVVFVSGLTVLWSDLSVVLVHTMVRLMSVAVVAVVVRKTHPELGFLDFFGWLTGFYLLALVTEVWMFYRQRGPRCLAVSVSDTEQTHRSE